MSRWTMHADYTYSHANCRYRSPAAVRVFSKQGFQQRNTYVCSVRVVLVVTERLVRACIPICLQLEFVTRSPSVLLWRATTRILYAKLPQVLLGHQIPAVTGTVSIKQLLPERDQLSSALLQATTATAAMCRLVHGDTHLSMRHCRYCLQSSLQ